MGTTASRLRAWIAALAGAPAPGTSEPAVSAAEHAVNAAEHAVNAIEFDEEETGFTAAVTGHDGGVQRPWHRVRALLEQAAAACETNPLAARLISMTTDFVIGSGATLRVRPASAQAWVQSFWNHPLNHLSDRIYAWCDELSRSGELFLVLSRNPVDGMSYVREIPALQIDAIETDPEDRERELRYHQLTTDVEGRWWPAARATEPSGMTRTERSVEGGAEYCANQVMLHYAINRPVGALRGRSDLAQILPWLERYDLWLEDRVRINRYKGAYLWHVRLDNAASGQLEAKRRQYARVPRSGSIIISDSSEHWEAVSPQINADDVAADGKAIRLMIAAGVGVPLHYLAEGDSATRATAREMGTPTLRHFAHRQFLFESILTDLIRTAARRGGLGGITVNLRFESVLSEADREETSTLPGSPLPKRPLPERPLPTTEGE